MTSGINVNMRYISILWPSLLRNNLFGMDFAWFYKMIYHGCLQSMQLGSYSNNPGENQPLPTPYYHMTHCLCTLAYQVISLIIELLLSVLRDIILSLLIISLHGFLSFFSIFSFCTPQSFPCQQHWPCPFPWSKLFLSLLFIWPPDVWHHWDHYTQQQFCKL